MENKRINLLRRKKNKKDVSRPRALKTAVCVVLILMVLGSFVYSRYLNAKAREFETEIAEIREFLRGEEIREESSAYQDLALQDKSLQSKLQEYKEDENAVQVAPYIEKSEIQTAMNLLAGTVEITNISYSGENKTIVVKCVVANANAKIPSEYVRKLREKDIFKDIGYQGYFHESDNVIAFYVTCYLKDEKTGN